MQGRTTNGDDLESYAHRGYPRWVGPLGNTKLGRGQWAALAIGAASSVLALAVVQILQPGGVLAGTVVLVGAVFLIATYVIVWYALTAIVHRFLLKRGDLGDYRRYAVFLGAFLAFPIVTLLLPWGLVMAISS